MLAFILDCIIGDPQNPLHPMRIIGNGVAVGVKAYKKTKAKSSAVQFIMGVILSILVIGLAYMLTWLIVWGFYSLNYWIGLFMEAVVCYFLIAPRALKDESMKVYRSLSAGDIESSRKNLSYIVGRDTASLSTSDIIKATVETISENLSDGVIAPLIFIFLGGAPLGMAYKAINTLDSMIGYRDNDFEHFGKFAARLDDFVNFIPSRISAILMILGSFFIKADTRGAVKIYLRDKHNHKSPNSAQTESVCAGALGLRLGGDSYYNKKLVRKPIIGDDIHEPALEHIIIANRLMYAATIIAVCLLTLGSAFLFPEV
jgi:adenosylcobinamide-phosphate synthase